MIGGRAGAGAAQSCARRAVTVILCAVVALVLVALPLCLVAGSVAGWWVAQ